MTNQDHNSSSSFINYLLDSLRRQFLQQIPPIEILLPTIPPHILQADDFQSRLYQEIFNPSLYLHQPSSRYASRVLKRLIALIEESAFDKGYGYLEINENLINHYVTLLISNPSGSSLTLQQPQQRTAVTYTITPSILTAPTQNPNHFIILHESRNIISSAGTTGSRTWEAALALGEFFITQHHHNHSRKEGKELEQEKEESAVSYSWSSSLQGKTILELGSGTGFLSILSAKLGAKKVLSTDGDLNVCEILRKNVRENNVDDIVKVKQLLWGDHDDDDDGDSHCDGDYQEIDLILGADLTYDISILTHLTHTIRHVLYSPRTAPGCTALISATIRNEETFLAFLNECKLNALKVDQLKKWVPPESRTLYYPTGIETKFLSIRKVGNDLGIS